MKAFLFILLSFSAFAQTEKIHGNNQTAVVNRTITDQDTSYTLTFKDQRYNLLDEHETISINLQQIIQDCKTVIETGEEIERSNYTLNRIGKKGLVLYAGNAYFYPTLKFFEKVCAKI